MVKCAISKFGPNAMENVFWVSAMICYTDYDIISFGIFLERMLFISICHPLPLNK